MNGNNSQTEGGRQREALVVFVAQNGERTSRMVGDKKAAQDVASKIRAKLQLGEFDFEPEKPEPKVPTFQEYADKWITTTTPADFKKSAARSYGDILRIHILPVFGGIRLNEINRGKVKDFFVAKILEGFLTSSVLHMKNAVSGVLNKAIDDEIIQNNVTIELGKIAQKKSNGETEEENGSDPIEKVLQDAIEALPDTRFVKNASQRRNASSNTVAALQGILETGNTKIAINILQHNISPNVQSWLIDGCEKTSSLLKNSILYCDLSCTC